jgi:hypothetical protein
LEPFCAASKICRCSRSRRLARGSSWFKEGVRDRSDIAIPHPKSFRSSEVLVRPEWPGRVLPGAVERPEDRRGPPVPSGHVLSETAGARAAHESVPRAQSSEHRPGLSRPGSGAGTDGESAGVRIAGRRRRPGSFDFGPSLGPGRQVRSGDRHAVASSAGISVPLGGAKSQPAGAPPGGPRARRKNCGQSGKERMRRRLA